MERNPIAGLLDVFVVLGFLPERRPATLTSALGPVLARLPNYPVGLRSSS